MTEAQTINPDYLPLTVNSLAEQFAACGLAAGQTVLVHSSLSKLGWVAGGEVAVIQALLHVLTPAGTLMMPTHTSNNTDPARWQHPPVPEDWWPIIYAHSPAYDPAITPTRGMGRIPELFRTWPGALRSGHPVGSFAALGAQAAYLTADHDLEEFTPSSPLGKLYELDGYILLLGVGHRNNSSLHVAEHRATFPGKGRTREGCAMLVDGVRQWVEYETFEFDTDDFEVIGSAYEATHGIPRHQVGRAEARFMRQRPLIDFAIDWMQQHRDFTEKVNPA